MTDPPVDPRPSRPAPPSDSAPDTDELPAGTVIGGCRVVAPLGQGGMGTVYQALQIALDKPVALKVLPRRLAEVPAFVDRFLREARLAARLEHPNIVQVFDTGTDAGHSFIVMQYVAGETLRERVRRAGSLPITVGLDYLYQAARGLAAAHKKRVVHRDVKPENLIVTTDGLLKVADFGLAQEEALTDEGDPVEDRVLASASFMSPEHADLQALDARSDLYSLGHTFWTLLAGRLPFTADTHLEWVLRHHLDECLPLTWVRRDVPLGLAGVVWRTMRKRPDERYASAEELLDDLARIQKFQLPAGGMPGLGRSVRTRRLDATSISRGGLRRCMDIQRAMKERGDALLPLGQIMLSNEYVRVVESERALEGADLPFCWPLHTPLPSLSEHPAGHPDERSLRDVASAPAEPFAAGGAVEPSWRLTRAPVALAFDGSTLVLRPLTKLLDPIAVQHLYDAVRTFPFLGEPTLCLDLDTAAALDVDDVTWIVECQHAMKVRDGSLRVRALDESASTFLRGHRLDEYLDVQRLGRSGAFASGGTSRRQAVHEQESEGDLAPTDAAVPAVRPVDEARALLANDDPRAAKAVLWPVLHKQTDVPDDARDLAGKVVATCLARAEAATRMRRLDEAKEWLDHAVDLVPTNVDALFQKALLMKKQGLLESALHWLDEAIRLRSNDAELYYNRAIVRARAGRWKDSVEDLTRAITFDPRHANAYYNRGIAFEKLGDWGRARNDFQLALKIDSRFQKILGPRLKRIEQRVQQSSDGVVTLAASASLPDDAPNEAADADAQPAGTDGPASAAGYSSDRIR